MVEEIKTHTVEEALKIAGLTWEEKREEMTEGITMSNGKDTKLNWLERFGDSDHQDLVAEIRKLRRIIQSFYGNNVDFSMFDEEEDGPDI